MKRILSMMLVVMMLAMSFTCIVMAEETTTVSISDATVKQGEAKSVTLTVSFSGANLKSGGFNSFAIQDGSGTAATKLTISNFGVWELPGNPMLNKAEDGTYAFAYSGNQGEMTVTFEITVDVAADAPADDYTVTCVPSFKTKGDSGEVATTLDFTTGKISVIEETNITAVEATPASVNVAYGADAAAINAALSAVKVLGDGATTGGTTVTDLDVTAMASAWDIAAVDTTKVAAHKATATLAASANGINIAESARAIEVTVNVDPLTVATADALVDVTVKKGAEGTDAAVKQAIIEGNAAITLKDAATGATDTVALTAEMITVADATDAAETVLDTSAAGNKTTADIKLAAGTESANKTFKLAEELTVDTVEISVKSSGSYTPSGIGKPIGGGNANFGGGVTEDNKTEDEKTEDGETTEDGKTEDGETTEDGKTEDGETTEDGKTEDGEVAGVEFADVAADYWAADYITTLKDMGIINGKAEGKFEPEAQLTRAEFAKMIAVAMNLTATATESTFTDCGADDWYTPFVIAVNEAGFVNGKGDAFDANGSISRQEICTILGRIVGATEGAALAFADAADVADWAADGVAAMVSLGVVNGYEDNTFKGAANATRAEVSKMLVAFLTATAETPAE